MTRRAQLVVMLKEPRPGRVKTRLGAEIGLTRSAWWFRHQCAGLLRNLRDPRWDITLAVSPDRPGMRSRIWPHDLARQPQGPGDLGARMARQFRSTPPGPMCIIGADIPGITRRRVARAFRRLDPVDAVFGPADDGGYWLVGLKRLRPLPRGLFQGTRWSTEYALEDSIASMPGMRIALADQLRDVDTLADLHALAKPVHP